MIQHEPNITIPVDLTNPGQFFACCGLLEVADRLWPGAEGRFARDNFALRCEGNLIRLVEGLHGFTVTNAMSSDEKSRLEHLSSMTKKSLQQAGFEEERKRLESRRREAPILFQSATDLRIDWFCDDYSGGSRFKTWAGQQSVLDITCAMHAGSKQIGADGQSLLWSHARGVGLPFNFDSELGGQGSALDIGFSFDPLAASEATRIDSTCKPTLELLAFVGLQRFRPREIPRKNRFVYAAWRQLMPPSAAAALVCGAVPSSDPNYEFRLLYRTKYLKSFLPAIPFQGVTDE